MPTQKRYIPVFTLVILGINVVVFLLMTFAGGSTNPEVLLDFGASFSPYFRRGEYWRLVMPMFLHIGWLHLIVNSYALFILGPILERVYGYGRFALLYVAAGMGSSALSMSLSRNIAAGASGAIFGIAGAMLVAGYLHRELIPPRWGRVLGRGILPFIVLNLILGFWIKGIDYWGHLGGLLTGMVLAALIPPPAHDPTLQFSDTQPSQAIIVLPVIVVALAMASTAQHYAASRDVTRLLREGERFRAVHQDAKALERFQAAAQRLPRDEHPHEMMGALYLREQQFDKAIQEYSEAVRLSPGAPEAELALGVAYRMKGDLPKAQQAFETALGKNPATAEGQRLLADLYAEQKLFAEAVQHYKQALQIEPQSAESHNNLAWLYATCEDPKWRDPRAALEHARLAVELTQWKEAGFIDTLAEANYASGSYREAVRIQLLALQLDPQDPELQEHMARYRKAAGG
ncbi:MAG TPA: rhomboid family intramembrane serine protease [Terriglobia bacterium]|nr:rhomboid family intramembrane serine protease [Terriglobia bacterium]